MTVRIAFVTSHPIQYQVPVFRLLAMREDVELRVFFAMLPDSAAQGDGFGVEFQWDIPLLEGYEYKVLQNTAKNPSVTNFFGCDTPGIASELEAIKADAVIVNGWVVKTCLQTLWACKRQGIPCFVRGEANDLRKRPLWKRMLQEALVRQYDACLYIGNANKKFYETRSVSSKRLFPVPYCIDNQRFERTSQSVLHDRQRLRKKWNIPADSTCFIYSGKFETKKHPIELVESFREANKQQSDLHLIMVGDGELRKACEEMAHKGNLPITFTGFLNQSEIISAYVAADCLVLCSDADETWGLVVNEAMACGRPALVSSLAGCSVDLIDSGITGVTFPFGDWRSLALKMSALGSEREILKSMGIQAQLHIEKYSPEAAANGVYDAVQNIIGSRER